MGLTPAQKQHNAKVVSPVLTTEQQTQLDGILKKTTPKTKEERAFITWYIKEFKKSGQTIYI